MSQQLYQPPTAQQQTTPYSSQAFQTGQIGYRQPGQPVGAQSPYVQQPQFQQPTSQQPQFQQPTSQQPQFQQSQPTGLQQSQPLQQSSVGGYQPQVASQGGQTSQPLSMGGAQLGFQPSTLGQQSATEPSVRGVGWSQRFAESVPNEVVTLTNDLDRLETVTEWAKSRATERGMVRLARVCDDIQDIAALEKRLVIRQSPFAQPLGEAAQQVIQNGIAELQQHLQQPEVQEALSEAQQSVSSINNALVRLQSAGMQGQQYAPVGGPQQTIGIQ